MLSPEDLFQILVMLVDPGIIVLLMMLHWTSLLKTKTIFGICLIPTLMLEEAQAVEALQHQLMWAQLEQQQTPLVEPQLIWTEHLM